MEKRRQFLKLLFGGAAFVGAGLGSVFSIQNHACEGLWNDDD